MDMITFEDFLNVEIRVGTITDARLNEKARAPAYVLTIDFGDHGIKTSSAQITQHYTTDDLQGLQVIAVMNFPSKRVAGVKSEVLVLASTNEQNGTVLVSPTKPVANGNQVA